MEKNNEEDIEVEVDEGELKKKSKEGTMKNFGVLNLKDMTEEEVADIKGIKNFGMLVIPNKFIGKISAKIKNFGMLIPYIDGWKLYAGKTTINAQMLEYLKEPLEFIQTGKLAFEDDVTPELVKEKIGSFRNYAKIVVPSKLYGAVMAKCDENMGKIVHADEE
ncbi:MAG: hypothetical protein NWF14_08350 [Candidatus Bathyarchaeota archaeon]|nr:hypothetical protein [Candidatus Bathyarchaeota archaeon]